LKYFRLLLLFDYGAICGATVAFPMNLLQYDNMTSFGARLKAERGRLGLTQDQLAKRVGISPSSQIGYEGDKASPPQEYLASLHREQIDIIYVLVGEYANTGSSPELAETAELLNQLPPAQKAMAFAVISLFQDVPSNAAKAREQVGDIWRAARLFRSFLKADPQTKAFIEKAAEIGDNTD
jgi:transcriptional regulator with XRE-family HTH domain